MAHGIDERLGNANEDDRATSSAEKRLGTVVGGSYQLKRLIGSGGSSHVFEAQHVRLGKPFAVKLLRPELDTSRRSTQRFRREARAIARLKNEHIVSVVDCGELDDGTPYLVMDLLDGEDLRSLLDREGSLPVRRAVSLVIEACRGLAEVHAAGLVHRDLKPENLFIARRSTGEDWCKILDFGAAKMEASLSTAQDAIVGTVRYMAPEQLQDAPAVGPATDIHALGAILYECLSGRAAQPEESLQKLMFGVMNTTPAVLSASCPELPAPLVDAVSRCLAKDQRQRPQTTGELERMLTLAIAEPADHTDATLSEDVRVARPAACERLPESSARPRWHPIATLALASSLGAGLAWSVKPSAPTPLRSEHLAAGVQPRSTSGSLVPANAAANAIARAPMAPAASANPGPASRAPLTPKPPRNLAPRSTASAPTPVSIGRFDQANPYGE